MAASAIPMNRKGRRNGKKTMRAVKRSALNHPEARGTRAISSSDSRGIWSSCSSAIWYSGSPTIWRWIALLRHKLVPGRGSGVKFEGLRNLTKALPLSPERAACVAECGIAEHAGLIHAFDVGHDSGPQQQSTLFDQIAQF